MFQPIGLLILAVVGVTAIGVAIARALVIAQPDEWLLCIRNGKLVRAGVGIFLWRRPGDVVARFTSTMQRVSFTVDALSKEQLQVTLQGFILWSVSPRGDSPFLAFQKLGLVNLDEHPRDLKSPKHLLTTPQHRAFQQLLGAAAQRLATTRPLESLLAEQDALVVELREYLSVLEREELKLAARLDAIRREAAASAEAITLVATAEEKKSQPVRDFELARLATERVGGALEKIPIHDARWISVGPNSPVGTFAELLTAARELALGTSKKAA